jgi:CBS domain containing-hemolysin-like protein
MSVGLTIALIAACVVLQGFFSGSEIALVSADRLRLQGDAKDGGRGATLALQMLEKPAWTLGTCLVGTNLCLIASSTLAAGLVTRELGLPAAVAAAFVVPFTLTLGEMVPKALYQHHADRLVHLVVFPLRAVGLLFAPVLFFIELASRLFGGSMDDEDRPVTRQELRLMLDSPNADGISADDRQLIKRVFAFTEATVEDAMVPLIQVVAVPQTATVAEAARRMAESGHSRLPVYGDRVDGIDRVVLHQDLLTATDWGAPVSSVAREAHFVPETKRVDELLLEMRRRRHRMVIAVDEYGGAVGLITVEDLLEEIVGEIEDESDKDPLLVRRSGEREWVASGRAEREHIEEACGLMLPDGDFETVAGFLLARLGRVPTVGESVRAEGFVVMVSKASQRAVTEVTLRRDR